MYLNVLLSNQAFYFNNLNKGKKLNIKMHRKAILLIKKPLSEKIKFNLILNKFISNNLLSFKF